MPFVDLLQQLGVEPFVARARSGSGVASARAPGDYGLSLIVGGIELTPLELAGIYATLAEDGTYVPLRVLADAPRAAARIADLRRGRRVSDPRCALATRPS